MDGKMFEVWSFIYTATAMYLMQHAPENETQFKNCGLYKVLKNGFVQREWEKCILYRDILLLVKSLCSHDYIR